MKRLILLFIFSLVCLSGFAQKMTPEEKAALKAEKKARREERANVRDSIYKAQCEARALAAMGLRGYDSKDIPITPSPFLVKGRDIVWQQIKQLGIGSENVFKAMLLTNNFRDLVQVDPQTIIGVIKPFRVHPQEYGFSNMESPTYLLSYAFGEAFFIMEIKDDKCRITVKDIRLTEINGVAHRIYGYNPTLYFFATKDGELDALFRKYGEKIYDDYLRALFTLTLPEW